MDANQADNCADHLMSYVVVSGV